MEKILLRKGDLNNLPTLDEGEPGFIQDAGVLAIGSATGNKFIGSALMGPNVFKVGLGHPYDTVQGAIDAAVTAGYVTDANRAYIAVAPGVYNESLTFSSGHWIFAMAPAIEYESSVTVIGAHAYNPTSGNQTSNHLVLQDIAFKGNVGNVITVGGTNGCRVRMNGCTVVHGNTANGYSLEVNNSVGAQARVNAYRCAFSTDADHVNVNVASGRFTLNYGILDYGVDAAVNLGAAVVGAAGDMRIYHCEIYGSTSDGYLVEVNGGRCQLRYCEMFVEGGKGFLANTNQFFAIAYSNIGCDGNGADIPADCSLQMFYCNMNVGGPLVFDGEGVVSVGGLYVSGSDKYASTLANYNTKINEDELGPEVP